VRCSVVSVTFCLRQFLHGLELRVLLDALGSIPCIGGIKLCINIALVRRWPERNLVRPVCSVARCAADAYPWSGAGPLTHPPIPIAPGLVKARRLRVVFEEAADLIHVVKFFFEAAPRLPPVIQFELALDDKIRRPRSTPEPNACCSWLGMSARSFAAPSFQLGLGLVLHARNECRQCDEDLRLCFHLFGHHRHHLRHHVRSCRLPPLTLVGSNAILSIRSMPGGGWIGAPTLLEDRSGGLPVAESRGIALVGPLVATLNAARSSIGL
jgi:hypothetical protein